jgi:hypothetical protein
MEMMPAQSSRVHNKVPQLVCIHGFTKRWTGAGAVMNRLFANNLVGATGKCLQRPVLSDLCDVIQFKVSYQNKVSRLCMC